MSVKITRVTHRLRPPETTAQLHGPLRLDVRFYRSDKPGQWTTGFTVSREAYRVGLMAGDIAREAALASVSEP